MPGQVTLKEGLHRGIDCKEEEEGKGSIEVWCARRLGALRPGELRLIESNVKLLCQCLCRGA